MTSPPVPDRLSLAITGGTVVTEQGERRLDVGISGDSIALLTQPGGLPPASRTIDAAGLYVLPGGIDSHTHIRWPIDDAEDTHDTAFSGTLAAALGGTTTVLDFVPPPSGVTHWEAALARIAEFAGSAVVDFSFHPMLASMDAVDDIPRLVEAGLASFKIFTTAQQPFTRSELRSLMTEISRSGGLPGFHAEDHDVLLTAQREVFSRLGTSPATFPHSRPDTAEAAAIQTVAGIGRELGVPLYIYHASGAGALAAVAAARAAGAEVLAETCTHYLVHDAAAYQREDAWQYVITPPIRGALDREALWKGLDEGTVQTVGSDHIAYAAAQKSPRDRVDLMPPGAPGISARLPFVWSAGVDAGHLTPAQFAAVTATNAARIFGLYPRKGTIAVGSDADLVLLDAARQWSWPAVAQVTEGDYDPYAGLTGRGRPAYTVARGRVVAADGQPADTTPAGEFLRQSPRR